MGALIKLLGLVIEKMIDVPKYLMSDGTPNPNYMKESDMWRRSIAGAVSLSLLLSVVLGAALTFVYLTTARAGEVAEVRANLLSKEIDAADTTICMEIEAGSVDPQIVSYRDGLVEEFEDITGRQYRHKPCDLLMKLVR